MHSEGYCSWVCPSVCRSVGWSTSHFTVEHSSIWTSNKIVAICLKWLHSLNTLRSARGYLTIVNDRQCLLMLLALVEAISDSMQLQRVVWNIYVQTHSLNMLRSARGYPTIVNDRQCLLMLLALVEAISDSMQLQREVWNIYVQTHWHSARYTLRVYILVFFLI